MGPMTAVGSVLTNFATFSGRASRSEFWWWCLLQSVGLLAVIVLDLLMIDPATFATKDIHFFSFFTPFFVLFTFVPTLAVTIRRLHDIGRSGAWYLMNLVPFGALLLFVFYLLPSEDDENIYGFAPGGPRVPPGGYDISDPYAPPKRAAKSNAFASYAVLAQGHSGPSPEQREVQRAQIKDYYRQRVLGQQS